MRQAAHPRLFAGMIALLMSLFLSSSVRAGSEVALPKGARLVLPSLEGISAEWVIPPSTQTIDDRGVSFGVQPDGTIWFGLQSNGFWIPEKDKILAANQDILEYLFLESGELVARSSDTFGILKLEERRTEKGTQSRLHFKPLMVMPYSEWRIFGAGLNNLYTVGLHSRKRVYQISLFGPDAKGSGKSRMETLYETDSKVSAVAGDAKKTYFSVGKDVFTLSRKKNETKIVYAHSKSNISELEYAEKSGLFYASESSVGYIGDKEKFDFILCSGCQIRIAGDSLYVLMGRPSRGVLKISGLREFQKLRL